MNTLLDPSQFCLLQPRLSLAFPSHRVFSPFWIFTGRFLVLFWYPYPHDLEQACQLPQFSHTHSSVNNRAEYFAFSSIYYFAYFCSNPYCLHIITISMLFRCFDFYHINLPCEFVVCGKMIWRKTMMYSESRAVFILFIILWEEILGFSANTASTWEVKNKQMFKLYMYTFAIH